MVIAVDRPIRLDGVWMTEGLFNLIQKSEQIRIAQMEGSKPFFLTLFLNSQRISLFNLTQIGFRNKLRPIK